MEADQSQTWCHGISSMHCCCGRLLSGYVYRVFIGSSSLLLTGRCCHVHQDPLRDSSEHFRCVLTAICIDETSFTFFVISTDETINFITLLFLSLIPPSHPLSLSLLRQLSINSRRISVRLLRLNSPSKPSLTSHFLEQERDSKWCQK